MADASGLLIALSTDDPKRRGSWSKELAAVGDVVVQSEDLDREAIEQATRVILVFDGESKLPLDAAMAAQWIEGGRLAVVQIGPGEADPLPPEVVLPADAAPREVALACEMVGRILQLRMESRHTTAAHDRLHELAHRDPLTGVLNRRGWDEALTRHFATTATGAGSCIAMIDLDHFKRINDQFGHAAGDVALKRTAEILAAELRPADVVARLGGDEFAVLIADVDRAAAAAVVDRLLHALRRGLSSPPRRVTASIGFAHFDASQSACMTTVDDALHEAKRQGRDRAVSDTN
jgi:diguanylate cyclase (GGDEF)-like protein